ncbi:hypothetical protein BDK51DRAFT_53153 [Blyttiomyces helicus]|uniref:F-box domain-containing protein n=1 Tax=Blyttiomyces helicus TaxID=388810 RepID=A0A4P9WNT9_9FUNG|nr:hypothetical protein BDK51DRAFT_53153 [Blyttiomyces helicus]|eukprot:RKO93368.1 hypothetical protein BDK51DRAFT_53153 [Blyttiomyces helicus]
MAKEKKATPDLEDDPRTIQLCADLMSSSLRRMKLEDDDSDLVNAHAACTRWLTFKPLSNLKTESQPRERDPDAAGMVTRAPAPGAHGPGGVWSHLPHDALRHILRLHREAERVQLSVNHGVIYGIKAGRATSMPPHSRAAHGSRRRRPFCSSLRLGLGNERARDIRFLHFMTHERWCVPRPLCLTFFVKLDGPHGLKMSCFDGRNENIHVGRILGPLIVDIVPKLNIGSPLFNALDLDYIQYPAVKTMCSHEALVEIKGIISRLEYLRTPYYASTAPSVDAAVGPALRFWPIESCSFPSQMTATSLPCLKCIEFSAFFDEDRPTVLTTFVHKLALLLPSHRRIILNYASLESENTLAALLAAFPTIRDIDRQGCFQITDATLAVLEKHPPLHHLRLDDVSSITGPAVAFLLRARGSQLRFLSLPWHGAVPIAAIALSAPNIECIEVTGCYNRGFPLENIRLVNDLLRACPRLKTFRPADLEDTLASDPSSRS